MSSDKFPFALVAPFSPYRANYSPQSASLIDAQTALKLAAASPDPLVAQSARWQQALFQVENGDYDAALQSADALKNSAYAPQAAALQGLILEKQNKLPEALQAWQRSQELSPSPATAAEINALQAHLAVKEN